MSPDSRFDEEGDWIARQFFSTDDLHLTPEEYVARHAHAIGCFSFHHYRYRDETLGAWVKRVGELLSDEGAIQRCRQRFLSSAEIEAVGRETD